MKILLHKIGWLNILLRYCSAKKSFVMSAAAVVGVRKDVAGTQ